MKGLKKKTTTQSQETLRSILDIMKEVAKKKKKKNNGGSNGDAYTSANASTEGRSREDDDHSEKMTVEQISLCISSWDTPQLGIHLIPEKMREE